ncbi:MAG: mechanosensitive ion channel family protein [bacterium]
MDPLFNTGFWQYALGGNSIFDYLAAGLIFVAVVFVLKWTQWLALRSLERVTERTSMDLDDALVAVVKTVKPPFYTFISFYVALRYLNIEGPGRKIVDVVLLVWLVYQVIMALQILIEFYIKRRMSRADDKRSQSVIQVVHSLLSIVLWAVAALFVLSNLGVDITSLIAGLGIGGIAVALAAQNILGDLFSSLAIYFDKPFEPGDFVIVGKHKGTVRLVGIKTTRIKSVGGEEIVVPNKDMTSGVLQNMGRMKERRVVFTFGVMYETTSSKLKNIPDLVKEIIKEQEETRFDRVHFIEFGDSALRFEAVYHVKSKEYKTYVDTHQKVLLGIKKRFEEEGIEMAYPTRTVYLKQA